MSPDLKVGIIQTLYGTWLHNSFALALLSLIVFCAFLLIFRPRRKFVFFLFGFIFLLLQFEYEKHFGKALEDQTINSVILSGGNIGTKNFLEDFFQKLIPFTLWFGGWLLIALGIMGRVREEK
ncbi:MAG: hypothetical protein Q7S03_01875 [bacterium]|nr:hypothetical protein [bacterium]